MAYQEIGAGGSGGRRRAKKLGRAPVNLTSGDLPDANVHILKDKWSN